VETHLLEVAGGSYTYRLQPIEVKTDWLIFYSVGLSLRLCLAGYLQPASLPFQISWLETSQFDPSTSLAWEVLLA